MRPIYITGHKNPDVDSIVSSIAYANYKKQKGIEAIASRIGPVDSDAEFLLNKFGFDEPLHIYTAKSTLREIDFDEAVLISPSTTIKDALNKLNKVKSKTLYVSDKERNLLGVVTINTISNIWLANSKETEAIIKTAKLSNISKILKAKTIVKPNIFSINGQIELSPAIDQKFNPGAIVVTSNKLKIEHAIKDKAGLIIALNNVEIAKKDIELAKKADVAIIASPLSAFAVSKDIYSAASVETCMEKNENIISVRDSMAVDEALNIIARYRYRAFPIIDGHNKIIGSVSRYHLFNYKKKQLILVDHNEKKQSIDDVDYGEVIEIVDHHRFGGFESENPISITTQIVGATCTIIANRYFEEKIKLDKKMAGLLLGGIVADTMNFKSPTTTDLDIEIAKKLEKISGENADELHDELVKESESLLTKRVKDIVYDDFKEFDLGGSKVGLSQAICKSFDEYKGIRSPLTQYLDEIISIGEYDLFVIMLTDPNGSGSYLIYGGNKQDVINASFPKMGANHFVNHLISRKKQLLPALIEKLGK